MRHTGSVHCVYPKILLLTRPGVGVTLGPGREIRGQPGVQAARAVSCIVVTRSKMC